MGLKHRDGVSGAKQPKTTTDIWVRGQNTSQAGDGGGGWRVTTVVFKSVKGLKFYIKQRETEGLASWKDHACWEMPSEAVC